VKLADIYISREYWPKAKEFLAKAIKGQPEDFTNFAPWPRSCGAKVNARTRSR